MPPGFLYRDFLSPRLSKSIDLPSLHFDIIWLSPSQVRSARTCHPRHCNPRGLITQGLGHFLILHPEISPRTCAQPGLKPPRVSPHRHYLSMLIQWNLAPCVLYSRGFAHSFDNTALAQHGLHSQGFYPSGFNPGVCPSWAVSFKAFATLALPSSEALHTRLARGSSPPPGPCQPPPRALLHQLSIHACLA